MTVRAGASLHGDDYLRIRPRLYFTNAIGKLIARGLIEPGLAHKGKVTTSFQKLKSNRQNARYLDMTGQQATSRGEEVDRVELQLL